MNNPTMYVKKDESGKVTEIQRYPQNKQDYEKTTLKDEKVQEFLNKEQE